MNPPRPRRIALRGLALMVALLTAATPAPRAFARPGEGVGRSSGQAREDRLPRAVARAIGAGQPGTEVKLVGGESRGSDLGFRWVQVGGPAVTLVDATRPEARFIAPDAAGPLAFLLVVSGPEGTDVAEVALAGGAASDRIDARSLAADAGDDQVGIVGRQVTLNGSRSGPRGRIGFRWIQTGGPAIRLRVEEGHYYSFVPTVPGVYRFALVVASHSAISTPDEVTIRVGMGRAAEASGDEPAADAPRSRPTVPTQEIARSGLASVRGGADAAEPLAKVFEDTADRMGVYSTYGEAFSEMSRRFEEILPAEPARRQPWVERVFQPLTSRTLEILRAEGLELIRSDGQDPELDAGQKAALAQQFRSIAEGFRSVPLSR